MRPTKLWVHVRNLRFPRPFILCVEFCLMCLLLDSRFRLLAPELIGSKCRTDLKNWHRGSLHSRYPQSENAIKKNLI